MEDSNNRPTTVADYLAILRRRKWFVIVPVVIAAAVAYVVSSRTSPVYRATAQILVDRSQALPAGTGYQDPCAGDPERCLETLARSSDNIELGQRVGSKLGLSPGVVLHDTSVTPDPSADVLDVAAENQSARVATSVANTFANEFTRYTTERITGRIDQALQAYATRLQALAAAHQRDSVEYFTLAQQQTQLQITRDLIRNETRVNALASSASQISPRPKRDALLAGLFGLVLGLALAFLAEALDRHVRDEHEIDDTLQIPLLARIPKPARRLQKANDLVMLKAPESVAAETYRKLRTSLEFVMPDDARTIMVTSAVGQEGKSTTLANLAVALARAGRRVAIVDLDLRAPYLARLFKQDLRPGITDVAVGRADLAQALRPIPIPAPGAAPLNGSSSRTPGNGAAQVERLLHLLPCGTIPPSADDMLQHPRLVAVVRELAEAFDIVLIDAPPLLAFGDAATLSARVDAMFAVTRLRQLSRPILHEFARQLQTCAAKALGYVVTGVEDSESYQYMHDGYVYEARARDKAAKRERV
jgi:Mrp family chromosome partitioning ATPase/capsular polysaccharide biosynthesis protein